MPPPPSKPKVPNPGVLLGDDEAPTQVQPRKLVLPRTPTRDTERTVVGRPAWSGGDGFEASERPTNPGRPGLAGRGGTNPNLAALTGEGTNPGRPAFTGVAPEVSKGIYHERSAAPRGLLPSAALLSGLDEALQKASRSRAPVGGVREQLKTDWLPLLRQAVEQAGGDGMDAYVTQLLAPPGRKAMNPLLADLATGMERLETAADANALRTAALAVRALVEKALTDKAPSAISLKLLERELDGRLEVDTMLSIRFASNAELLARRDRAGNTLEDLRLQMRSLPAKQPGGIFSNFARVKVEKRVMDAEARRRGLP